MHYHWMIVYIPHSNISCNFFMPIISKRQPLHRPSIQSPRTFLFRDVIAAMPQKNHFIKSPTRYTS